MEEYTELALTLGRWGYSRPPEEEVLRRLASGLTEWTGANNIRLRLEVYPLGEVNRSLAGHVLELCKRFPNLQPVARTRPRSDLFRRIHDSGFREVVFEVPAGRERAAALFKPNGMEQATEFAIQAVEQAAIAGLRPEIALVDITRASEADVVRMVEPILRRLRAREVTPRWRLVDDLGLGKPLPGARLPRSLPSWIRLLHRDFEIDPTLISIQAADLLGLALANTLAAVSLNARPVCSLFGSGHRTGWTGSEAMLLHTLPQWPDLRSLIELRKLLPGEVAGRDPHRPVYGALAYETPAGTTPEQMDEKVRSFLPFDPVKILGIDVEPLLTGLSGKAGHLHLVHRHHPGLHVESDDPRMIEIYRENSRMFLEGRKIPVRWSELEPLVRKKGIIG